MLCSLPSELTNDFCVYYSGSRFDLDCDWSSHLLHPAAVRGRWSLCDLQEEVRSLTGMLPLRMIHPAGYINRADYTI